MSEPLRVLLVDDHVLFRKGVDAVLATRPEIEVVGEAGDGLQAIDLAREMMPDVILMDISMPNCDGLEATRRIKSEMPHVKIVMLIVSDDDKNLFQAIKCGAQGYLIKDLKAHLLFDVLDALARGDTPLSSAMATKILQEFREPVVPRVEILEAGERLTPREIEVLVLIVEGRSNRDCQGPRHLREHRQESPAQHPGKTAPAEPAPGRSVCRASGIGRRLPLDPGATLLLTYCPRTD